MALFYLLFNRAKEVLIDKKPNSKYEKSNSTYLWDSYMVFHT